MDAPDDRTREGPKRRGKWARLLHWLDIRNVCGVPNDTCGWDTKQEVLRNLKTMCNTRRQG